MHCQICQCLILPWLYECCLELLETNQYVLVFEEMGSSSTSGQIHYSCSTSSGHYRAPNNFTQNEVQPVEWPTPEELESPKLRYQYSEGRVHIAIAGYSGTGKSSLVNAFRGLKDSHKGAAATGHNETTRSITRYPNPNYPVLVWFDVPGGGTLSMPDWQYFNTQGLYIFDAIIVLFSIRFTAIDIPILQVLPALQDSIVHCSKDYQKDAGGKAW